MNFMKIFLSIYGFVSNRSVFFQFNKLFLRVQFSFLQYSPYSVININSSINLAIYLVFNV